MRNIISYSGKTTEFAEYLGKQLEKLVTAQIILIALKKANRPTELLSISIPQDSTWDYQPRIEELVALSYEHNETRHWDKTSNRIIKKQLYKLEIENIITIPVVVGGKRIGSILLLNISETIGIENIVSIIEYLSGVFGLVLKNSMTQTDINENTIQRTEQIQRTNEEQGKKRLESLSKINQLKLYSTQELLDYTLAEAIKITESKFGYMYFYNNKTQQFTLNSLSKEETDDNLFANQQTLFQLEETGILADIVRLASPIVSNNLELDHTPSKAFSSDKISLDKLLTIPVIHNGQIVAIIIVANKQTNYNEQDIAQLNILLDVVWWITDKRRIEQELRLSEKQNSLILKTALDGFCKLNKKGEFLYVNDAYCEMIGYNKTELLNMDVNAVEEIENTEGVLRIINNLLLNGANRFTTKHRCKDGSIIDVLISINYLKDEDIIFVFVQDITQKTSYERKLAESEQTFRMFYDNAPLSYQSLDINACLINVNKFWLQTLGYERDEVIGRSFGDFMTPNSAKLIETRFEHFKNTGSAKNYIFEMIRKDGRVITVTYEGSIGYDEFGQFKQTYCLFKNITKEQIAEQRLIESEQKFRDVFESSLVGKSMTTLNGNLNVNNAFCEILGYSKEVLQNINWREITHQADIEQNEKIIQSIINAEVDSSRWEKRYIHANGQIVWADITTTLRRSDQGEPLYYITEMVDISERKKAELELKESEERYKLLFQANFSTMLIIDPENGNIVDANPAACNFYGWPYEELCKKNIIEINTATKKDSLENIQLAKKEKSKNFNFVHKKANGSLCDVDVYSTCINYGDKILLNVIIHDITERKKAEKTILNLKEEFQAIFENNSSSTIIIEPDTTISLANNAFHKLSGYSKNEIIGKSWKGYIAAQNSEQLNEYHRLRLINKKDAPENYEFTFKRKNGEFSTCYMSVSLIESSKKVIASFVDISDLKNAQTALKESEERFKILFEKAPLGYQSLNNIGNIININETWTDTLGYKKEEVIGKWFGDLLTKSSKELFRTSFNKIKKLGHFKSEFELLKKDGSIITAAFVGRTSYNFAGKFTNIHAVFQDVTEQREMERSLAESERRFRELLSSVQLVSLMFDLNGNITFCNDFLLEKTQWKRDEIIAKNWFDNFIPNEEREKVRTFFNTAIQSRKIPVNYENQILTKKNEEILIRWTNNWLFDNNENINGIASLGIDITESRKAEKALRESEKKLSALFTSMSEMVSVNELIFDENGLAIDYKIIDCNEAFTTTIQLKKENVVNKLATKIYKIADTPFLAEFNNVCHSSKNKEIQYYFQPLDMYFHSSIVHLDDTRFATITTNITEIQKTKEALIEKNNEIENYLFVASHDLRSPLVNIQGFSKRLERQTANLRNLISNIELKEDELITFEAIMNDNIPKSLNYILANVTKMDNLINGLLQLSRTGRVDISIKQLRMGNLFKNILSSLDFQLTESKANVIIGELIDCYGDEIQINQVFSNIINNAIKYRNKDNTLTLEISSTQQENRVIYAIRDNGIGIEANSISKIWNIFYRVNPTSEITGEGMGLSLAKRIVEKHRGRVWVESNIGQGSVFYVELQQKNFDI